MDATHRFMGTHPCAKYGMPLSNNTEVIISNLLKQADRQNDANIPP